MAVHLHLTQPQARYVRDLRHNIRDHEINSRHCVPADTAETRVNSVPFLQGHCSLASGGFGKWTSNQPTLIDALVTIPSDEPMIAPIEVGLSGPNRL